MTNKKKSFIETQFWHTGRPRIPEEKNSYQKKK